MFCFVVLDGGSCPVAEADLELTVTFQIQPPSGGIIGVSYFVQFVSFLVK